MAKKITLDPAALPSSGEAKLRDLTYTPSGGSATTVKALLSAAVTIPPVPADTWPPTGWQERTVKIYLGDEILDAVILVKTAGLSSTAYGSTQRRKLLQVVLSGSDYKLGIDYGKAVD